MPVDNLVSIQIPQETFDEVKTAVDLIVTKLQPFIVALSADERKNLAKMSDKTIPFVEKTLNYAESDPEFAPAYLNVDELKIDMKAVGQLKAFFLPLEQLNANLDDTILLAGSEAYVAALAYYNSVKQAAKMNVLKAKTIYEDLSQRFPGRKGGAKPPAQE